MCDDDESEKNAYKNIYIYIYRERESLVLENGTAF